jgi:hypothetical protein
MQLVQERGVVILEDPRTRRRVAFRFESRRALTRFIDRVTGQPDGEALQMALQYVEAGRAVQERNF